MTRGELKDMFFAEVASAKPAKFTDTVLDNIFKRAARDLAIYGVLLPTDSKFAAVADQSQYNLSSVLTNYLTPDRPGLWWNSGTVSVPSYKQLDAVTVEWMDINRRNWRDAEAGEPQVYWIEKNVLNVWPKPEDSLTDAFWFYYGQGAYNVGSDDEYFFYGTTELPHLAIFDDALLSFAKWKSLGGLDKKDDYMAAEKAYYREREEKCGLANRNLGVNNSRYNRFTSGSRRMSAGRFRV